MNGLILSEPRPDAVCVICREGFTEDAFTDAPQDREKQAVSHFIGNKQAGHDPFHQECIQQWMKISLDCPHDRLPIYHSYADNPHFNWLAPLATAAQQAIFAASLTLAVGLIPILATETLEFQDTPKSFFSPLDDATRLLRDDHKIILGSFIASAAVAAAAPLQALPIPPGTFWTIMGRLTGMTRLTSFLEGFLAGVIALDAIGFGMSGTEYQFNRLTPYAIGGVALAPITQCANWIFHRMELPEIGQYNIPIGVSIAGASIQAARLIEVSAMTSTTEEFVSAVVASGISTALISLLRILEPI